MSSQDIRWKQRFQQFGKVMGLLKLSIAIENCSVVEQAGMIHFFELSFELAWKLLKDYLTEEGFDAKSPRAVIKLAFQQELIPDGHVWIRALQDRNLTTHTYNEETADLVEQRIRDEYLPFLLDLEQCFQSK